MLGRSARNNPATVLADGFSARISSTRNLAAGLYQIKTTSDDGIRVSVNGQSVMNAWYDQGSNPPHSGFFYWSGGNAPITVEYYDSTGSAGIAFELKPVTAFTDANLDASTRWLSNVFTWNSTQATPASNFYENLNNRIGAIDQGSSTRADGKKGISFNLGKGALLNDPNRLPDDLFAVRSYTWADFDGTPYKFHVSGDDGYQILAKQHGTNQWYYITPQNQWQYGTQDIQASLPTGRYDLHFHYFENGGDAAFDLSWEKATNPDINIQESFVGSFGSKESVFRQAVSNWESIITQHQSQNGLINMTFTFDPNFNWGGSYGYAYANDALDDNNSTIYLNPALLYQSDGFIIRLVMHEIGHTLGLGNTPNPSNPNDNVWHGDIFGNPYTQGLMNYSCLPGTATENSLMYNELQALGYQFNRFGISAAGSLYY